MTGKSKWLVVYEVCRVCASCCIGVVPAGADLDALECGNCGNMTSEAVSEEEYRLAKELA